MRAIADGSIDGFPDQDEVRTVFVEADIQGELSHLNCVDYVLNSPSILNAGITENSVREMLKKVVRRKKKKQLLFRGLGNRERASRILHDPKYEPAVIDL